MNLLEGLIEKKCLPLSHLFFFSNLVSKGMESYEKTQNFSLISLKLCQLDKKKQGDGVT